MNKTCIVQLFETFGDTYQPYIPPVINVLQEQLNLDITILVFNKTNNHKVHLSQIIIKEE